MRIEIRKEHTSSAGAFRVGDVLTVGREVSEKDARSLLGAKVAVEYSAAPAPTSSADVSTTEEERDREWDHTVDAVELEDEQLEEELGPADPDPEEDF